MSRVETNEIRGYSYAPMSNLETRMAMREEKLEHQIRCSQKISTLLSNWIWNATIAGGILLLSTAVICFVVLILHYAWMLA